MAPGQSSVVKGIRGMKDIIFKKTPVMISCGAFSSVPDKSRGAAQTPSIRSKLMPLVRARNWSLIGRTHQETDPSIW